MYSFRFAAGRQAARRRMRNAILRMTALCVQVYAVRGGSPSPLPIMGLAMKYRQLGRTGIAVSEIGYGAWGISGKQWIGASDKGSLAALRKAIELGVNFIDTALAYGDGKSEELVGQAVAEASERIYIATKVPPKNRLWPARPGIGIDEVYPPNYIVSSTEQSLRNLRADRIDLQQLHV